MESVIKPAPAQCWFKAEEYEEIRAALEDGQNLPAAHADWLAGALRREDEVRKSGQTPLRADFDLASFARFCARFRVPRNSHSCVMFAMRVGGHTH